MRTRMRVVGWMGVAVTACLLLGGDAHGRDDVTSRDIEKAFRTLRRAIRGGAEPAPFGKPQVMKLVAEAGGKDFKDLEPSFSSYTFEGNKVIVVFYEDGDLQLRHTLTGGKWSSDATNEWNRTQRVGKCYLQEDGDVTLEYTLLSTQGPSEAWFRGALTAFHKTLSHYGTYIRGKNQDGDK